jgi:hypothetical protein
MAASIYFSNLLSTGNRMEALNENCEVEGIQQKIFENKVC